MGDMSSTVLPEATQASLSNGIYIPSNGFAQASLVNVTDKHRIERTDGHTDGHTMLRFVASCRLIIMLKMGPRRLTTCNFKNTE